MTSYQRRLQEIKFYKQCIAELEDICKDLWRKSDQKLLPLGIPGALTGDKFLTHYNTGGFYSELLSTPKEKPCTPRNKSTT